MAVILVFQVKFNNIAITYFWEVVINKPIDRDDKIVTHEMLGEWTQTESVLDGKPPFNELTTSILDALQVKEVRGNEQRLHILVRDLDLAIVRIVNDMLESARVDVVEHDNVLFGLEQIVMHKHGIKVRNTGR